MTEQQAIEALHALPRLPRSGASLERMQALLDHLGNPEKQFKCIHIAGTNGKGTLAAMTSSILTHAGYKTGLTISPYVLNFRERFQINGQMMSPRTLASLTRKVLDAADAIIAEGGEGPVEFEAVTAIAFLWFARQKCDFAVVETGLGGRYDATNVIPAPLVAAITRIGMDHTEILGDTLAEIAAEKAGIIKEGSVVVCYPEQPEEAMGPLLTAAANAHTSLVVPDTADLQQLKCRPLENYVDYGGYRALLQFPGKHQANHAAMAVEIALALWREYHYEIPDEAIEAGLRDAKMPARIEVMRRHPLLLLDGCHNADGTAALAATLKEAGYDGNLVAVLGLLKDKDHSKMLENLAPCFEKVFTVTPDSPRAMTAEELEEEAKYHMDAEPLENLADQFARFPGIGRKGAVRMAYEVMSMSNEQAMELAKAIENAKVKLHRCRLCQDYTANEVCSICASPKRDRSVICVVESPRDVKAIERTHEFNGLYHVLHGLISPMDGIGADQLCVKELLARLDGTVKEVIMATSPTVEGEATAMYLAKLIKPLGIKTTRLAYGLPVGSSLEYADETTLYRAMEGRGEM